MPGDKLKSEFALSRIWPEDRFPFFGMRSGAGLPLRYMMPESLRYRGFAPLGFADLYKKGRVSETLVRSPVKDFPCALR